MTRVAVRFLVVLALSGAHCPEAPPPRELSEVALTAGAEAFTAWMRSELAVAAVLPDAARYDRVEELEAVNESWNRAEDAFAAAWALYDMSKDPRDYEAACRAYDRAVALLASLGVAP